MRLTRPRLSFISTGSTIPDFREAPLSSGILPSIPTKSSEWYKDTERILRRSLSMDSMWTLDFWSTPVFLPHTASSTRWTLLRQGKNNLRRPNRPGAPPFRPVLAKGGNKNLCRRLKPARKLLSPPIQGLRPGLTLVPPFGLESFHLELQRAVHPPLALTGRGGSHRVLPSKIIRSIAEASEVTRQWRTLNISTSSSKASGNGMSGGKTILMQRRTSGRLS